MDRVILRYDHLYITGNLKGLVIGTRVNLTDISHAKSFIRSLVSKRSSEGHISAVITGDLYIPGNFTIEIPIDHQESSSIAHELHHV